MTKGIISVDEIVIIDKIILPPIVRRIDVYNVNMSLMRFLQQIQTLQIVALKDKIIIFAFGNCYFLIGIFRENRNIFLEPLIHLLRVFLPHKPILLVAQMIFNFRKCAN